MRKQKKSKSAPAPDGGTELHLGGLFGGIADLVSKLGDLAAKGEELRRSGTLNVDSSAKGLRGVYGFSVKVGLGGEGVQVEPFGNVHRDAETGQSEVQEVREPLVDLFEEEQYLLIVAEMPGIGPEQVRLDLQDDLLTIQAEHGDKRYRKEVLLPGTFQREKMEVSCNNGVLEIKCPR